MHDCTALHRHRPAAEAPHCIFTPPPPARRHARPEPHVGALDARGNGEDVALAESLIHDGYGRLERPDYGGRWPRGRRHLDLLGRAAVRRSTSNPRPSRHRTAPATAHCVDRPPAGVPPPQASLDAAAAGAGRRIDPFCPGVQVAPGGQMEPLTDSWRDPTARLAVAARPQARPRLWVHGLRLRRLVGPCLGRWPRFCAYSPRTECLRLLSLSSSLVVYYACRGAQTHEQ